MIIWGLCIEKCPMKNIALEDNRAVPKGKCTMIRDYIKVGWC